MKKLILLVLAMAGLGALPVFSQISLLDDADRAVLQPFNDHDRSDTLIEWAYQPPKSPKAQLYTLAALEYATKARHHRGRADCYVKLGHLALFAGRNTEAGQWYAQGLRIRDSLGLVSGVASCYNNLGLVQKKLGNYDSAAVYYRAGLHLLETTPADNIAIQLHNNLGTAFRSQGRYADALDQFRQSMALSRKGNKLFNIAQARLNIGNLLQDNLNRFDEARDSLNVCLADFSASGSAEYIAKSHLGLGNTAYYTGHLTEALHQYDLALAPGLAKEDVAIALKNRGRVLLEQQKFEKALKAFQASLDTFTTLGNKREVAAANFEIGNLFYEQSELAPAVEYYKKGLASPLQDTMLQARVLYFLSDALDQLGRKEEASQYTQQYTALLAGLNTGRSKEIFQELMQYHLAKNRLLKQRSEQEKETARAYGIAGAALLSLLLLLAIAFALLARARRRRAEQNEQIALQEKELARQNEQLAIREKLDLLKNKELETNYARLAGQDEIQKKIGQELHDSVGAMLASIKLNLSPVDEVLDQLPENNRRQYATANRLLGEASEEVRRISHQLSSAVLQKFGLKAQLEALADIIPDSGKLQVELATHGLKDRLEYKTELHIYRMVQELVHNVVKHAQARNITIQVNRFEHTINVIVEDDGCGFDVEHARQNPGIGMQNLAARVHDLNGDLQYDSRPGRGTTVSIDIPLKS